MICINRYIYLFIVGVLVLNLIVSFRNKSR